MKSILIIYLCILKFTESFIPYPFVVDGLLEKFLGSLSVVDQLQNSNNLIDLSKQIPGEECKRECVENDARVCRFNFMMKYFQVMGGGCRNCSQGIVSDCLDSSCVIADGVKRGFLSLNFQLPGPSIHVCKNDIVVVELTNEAEGTASTIHWHGIHQMNSQFMDGVPWVTQCPIQFGLKFMYAFKVEERGTHYYHSHAGHQHANGIYGALVVREPKKAHSKNDYDFDLPEHLIIVTDWMHHLAEEDYPGMISRSALTESILINGHGRYYNTTSESYSFGAFTVYNVEYGQRYRFRFINAGFNVCPLLLQIESHDMTIIATEISYVKPFSIDSLFTMNGERFDFVVNAVKEPRDYWIRVKTMYPCRTVIEAFAVLRYGQEYEIHKSSGNKVVFTHKLPPFNSSEFPQYRLFNSPLPKVADIPLLSLKSYQSDMSIINPPPDQQFYLFLDTPLLLDDQLKKYGNYYKLDFETSRSDFNTIGTFNNISLKYPAFPILTQPNEINESMFCNENSTRGHHCFENDILKACKCTYRIKLKLNAIIEFIVVNVDDKIAHPIHLHGHKFHVVDMGVFQSKPIPGLLKDLQSGLISNTTHQSPPYKDTVVLPYPGYVRLRFRANNPGFWLFHCHFDWHLTTGMAIIFQVGELDNIKQIKVPENFPKCGNFKLDKL